MRLPMLAPRIFPMVPCGFPMVPCGSPIVLCCFPMVLCHGAAIRRSPAQLCGFPMVPCGFPMVLCHGAAIRRSPAQLCGLPYGAVPRRCHQALTSAALPLPCRSPSAAASTSVPRSPALQQICYWQSAQKCRFCAREDGKVASGSVKVAFLQITAHVSKTQMPHNQQGAR